MHQGCFFLWNININITICKAFDSPQIALLVNWTVADAWQETTE